MIININKNLKWKEVIIVLLDFKHQVVKKEKLSFIENKSQVEVDLNNIRYCYFTNSIKNSEVVILSKNTPTLNLYYNRRKNLYSVKFSLDRQNNYGRIDTLKIKDEKNLYYRKDQQKLVHIYTPKNFSSKKEYNLLIMFDSQNIFDPKILGQYTKRNDPYGSWQIETSLNNIKSRYQEEFVVIGIDNSDSYRDQELTPNQENWQIKRRMKHEFNFTDTHLDDLLNFIHQTLIPKVKKKYQLKTSFVGIAGSSSGGLASIYGGIKYYNFYQFILSFTPAIGLATDRSIKKIYKKYIDKSLSQPHIFFFQGKHGELEKILYRENKNFIKNLIKCGIKKENIDSYIEENADHNEDYWRYAFNYAMEVVIERKLNTKIKR